MAVVKNKKPLIIENPTKEDFIKLDNLAKQEVPSRSLEIVRLMANANTRKVYVADGYYLLHSRMCDNIFVSFKDREKCPWLYFGNATVENGIATNIPHKFYSLNAQLNYNWSFVDNYIVSFEYDLYTRNGKSKR